MSRRNFLKSSVGLLLIPLAPSLVLAEAPKDLKAWFESNFNCKQGEPGSTIAIEKETYTYHTCAAGILNCSEDEAQKRLTHYFIEQFYPLSQGKPDLWWRVEPQFAAIELVDWGSTWMTAEEIEDCGKLTKLPKNVEYDFETNSYKYVNSKETLYRMRFRLVIPTQDKQLQGLAKLEGEKIRKI